MNIKSFFAKQKYRFDLGYTFLVIVNLVLLVTAASDKLTRVTGARTWALVVLVPAFGVGGMWCFGWILDKIRYAERYNEEIFRRNPPFEKIQKSLDRIERILSRQWRDEDEQ